MQRNDTYPILVLFLYFCREDFQFKLYSVFTTYCHFYARIRISEINHLKKFNLLDKNDLKINFVSHNSKDEVHDINSL